MSRARRRSQARLRAQSAKPADLTGAVTNASILGQRSAWLSALTRTFGGKRDIYDTLGYRKDLTVLEYRWRYARNAVAARIMEAFPKATWRHGAEIVEDDDPETETTFEKAFAALARRLNFWSTMQRADILAGLGRFSGIVIGAAGDMEQPLGKLKGPEAILYLAPYSEDELKITQWEQDPEDERYGLPTQYQLVRRTILQDQSWITAPNLGDKPRLIHWTRVLHVTDGLLDDRVFGTPRLERVWNLLDDLEKITGGGAEAFWLRANQGLLLSVDKDVIVKPEELSKMQEEVDEYVHGMSRVMKARGVTATPLGADTADFSGNAEAILTQICAGVGIPRRLLEGSELGELASTQDRSNWTDRVSDRRKDMAEPHVRAFVDRLIEAGALPAPKGAEDDYDDDYQVVWPREEDLTLEQRVAIVVQLAQANAEFAATAGEPLILPREVRDEFLHLEPLDDVLEDGETGLAPMPVALPDGTTGFEPGTPIPPGAAQPFRPAPSPEEVEKAKAKYNPKPKPATPKARAAMDVTAITEALRRGDEREAQRIIDDALGLVPR